jgi:hypothetical protein
MESKEGNEMKYIAFWKYCQKDTRKVIEKYKKSDLGLKQLFPPHHIGGQAKGFTLFETDDPMDLIKFMTYYSPEMSMKIYPITESAKSAEHWLKTHK